jgi:lipoate-protein ligase A
MSLPAEEPGAAIAADEALLDRIQPDGKPLERWWLASSPAIVAGIGLRSRLAAVIDFERCRAAGIQVLQRRAGGGALLLDTGNMLCGAICAPTSAISSDVTESYRWLGDYLAAGLNEMGILAHRVEVEEARADVAALRSADDAVSRILLSTCYGALSPHEVTAANEHAKVVGLAQVRRRHAALFQIGILLKDQSGLADYMNVPDEPVRKLLRAELARRTIGLQALTDRSASEVVAAIAGATPYAP